MSNKCIQNRVIRSKRLLFNKAILGFRQKDTFFVAFEVFKTPSSLLQRLSNLRTEVRLLTYGQNKPDQGGRRENSFKMLLCFSFLLLCSRNKNAIVPILYTHRQPRLVRIFKSPALGYPSLLNYSSVPFFHHLCNLEGVFNSAWTMVCFSTSVVEKAPVFFTGIKAC